MEVRNETIVKLLETLGGILENRHTGISTMNKKMKEANLPEPIFSNEREDFVVTFYNGEYPELYPEELLKYKNTLEESKKDLRRKQQQTYEKTYEKTYENIEEKILKFCSKAKSAKEIAGYCGFKSVDRFKRNHIKPLLEDKKIKMTIPDKPTSKNQKYITNQNGDR